MIRSTILSTRLLSRQASTASEATKAATEKASKAAQQVSDKASNLASESTSSASKVAPEGSFIPSSVINKASSDAPSGTAEAASRFSSAVKEFTSVRPSTSTVFNDAASDARSTGNTIVDIAKGAFASVTGGSNTTSDNYSKMSSSGEKLNASGLTPSESKKLPVIQPSAEDKPILDAVKTLYECKPKNETYSIFAENAVFHDPLSIAEGLDRIKVQYNGLVALFPKATVDRFNLLEAPKNLGSETLLVDQTVTYYRSKEPGADPTKQMNSLLTIQKGNDGKVIKLTEEWNHDKVSDSNNGGFLGMLNEGRKKAFAAACMPFISQEAPESK